MQRILHVIGSLNNGGSQAVVMNLYRQIDRSKLQFDFVIDRPEELFYAEEVKQLGGMIYVVPAFRPGNIFRYLKVWKKFFEQHKEYRIIHGHVRSTASIYLGIARKYGVTTIIHSHSTTSGKGFSALVKTILQYPLRFQADYLFACSKKAGEWLYGKKACQKANFKVINNAIEISKYTFNKAIRQQIRSSLQLEGRYVVGHVGRFDSAKNHKFLLDIFAEILKIKNNAVLLLIGDGQLRTELVKKIELLELQQHVLLLGYRSDITHLLQAMDAFVFPSLWEGLPVSVIEAQAAGLPCFISDHITEEVCITTYIKQLSLKLSPKIWAEEIIGSEDSNREKLAQSFHASDYDATALAEQLQNFYESLER